MKYGFCFFSWGKDFVCCPCPTKQYVHPDLQTGIRNSVAQPCSCLALALLLGGALLSSAMHSVSTTNIVCIPIIIKTLLLTLATLALYLATRGHAPWALTMLHLLFLVGGFGHTFSCILNINIYRFWNVKILQSVYSSGVMGSPKYKSNIFLVHSSSQPFPLIYVRMKAWQRHTCLSDNCIRLHKVI